MTLKIALLQLLPGKTLEEQLQLGSAACERAKTLGADIALFPEMWSCGYSIPQDKEKLDSLALTAQSSFVRSFADLASRLEMAIGITFLEKGRDKPLNSIIVFDRLGKEVIHYSKVHTCGFDLEKVLASGEDFYTGDLDTGETVVKIGSMICYDREFPESARVLMLKGAEIILVPNACDMNSLRINQLSTRAFENMVGVAMANYPGKGWGCSCAFSPIVFDENGNCLDNIIVKADDMSEDILIAEFDMNRIRTYRERETWGNA